jgi:UDP-3-O-[3-hydroxymyristoyl] glucosamine N-acyltransferase
VFGGQVGLADNIRVGDRVVVGGGSKVLSNVPSDRVVQGYPAVKMETHVESYKAMRRLPRLLAELRGGRTKGQKPVSKTGEND